MLKFADLIVNEKNNINTLDSFTKYFPNSYMPLLMMYLGRHELLELVENPEISDERVFVKITHEEIEDFFSGSKYGSSYNEIRDELISQLKENLDDKDIDKFREYVSTLSFALLLNYRDNEKVKVLGMRIKEGANTCVINILNILSKPVLLSENNIVCYFLLLWNIYWDAFVKYRYSDGDESTFQIEKWITTFEEALAKIQAYSRDKMWMQPEELTKVVLSKKRTGRMFNPFAGLASYSVRTAFYENDFYNKDFTLGDKYIGQEIDNESWAVGKIRLLAYGTDSDNYTIADSTNWTEQRYFNVISTPPFGVKIVNEKGKREYADNFVLRRSIDTMLDNGMTACVVPASFLTRKDSYLLRKKLVDEKLVDTIVALPEGLFLPYTNIKTAIVFLKKCENQSVKFIDATKNYITVNGREKKLLANFVINLIEYNEFPDYLYDVNKNNIKDAKNVFLSSINNIRNEEVVEKDYSFNVHSYIRFSESKEGYEEYYLDNIFFPVEKDIDEIIKKTKPDEHGEWGRLLTSVDLGSNPLIPDVNYTSLNIVHFDDTLEVIQGPAILFSLKGEFRVSLLRNDQLVFVHKDEISAFGYNPEEFYGEYIVNELFKHYIKEQLAEMELEELRTEEDIKLLKIISPIENPNDYIHSRSFYQKEDLLQERNRRLLSLEQQLSELKDKQQDEFLRSLRQRKHRIQQVMNELCPAFSLLDKRRKENGILHNDDIVGKRTGKTVKDYFMLIGNAIDKVENMVTHIVDEDEWGESEFFKLKDFLTDITTRSLSDKFAFKVNYNVNDGYGEDSILVDLNKDKFATVFENMFANAQEWGFVDPARNDYCIRIDVDKPTSNSVRIRVTNNGKPIDASLLEKSRIFEWGIGNHTGYGTWQMKNIIEHYLGTVEVHSYPDDPAGFQTEFIINIPAYL